MRIIASIVIAALPLVAVAQERTDEPNKDGRIRVEATGCVKGSTLTQTSLRIAPDGDGNPPRRWRLRGAKQLMKRLKAESGKELEIVGTMKDPEAVMGGTRIGRSNVYIGGSPISGVRDPLPDLPTIDVESFELTGETCR
jgi:hypothetical protein